MVRPTISYRVLELGGGGFEVGVVAGAYAMLSLILAMPLGVTINRFGERRFILAGTAVLLAACLGNVWASTVPLLIVTQAVLGLGGLAVALGIQTRAASSMSAGRRAQGLARLAVAAAIGQVAGPVIAGAAMDVVGRSSVVGIPQTWLSFALASCFALISVLLAFPLRTLPHAQWSPRQRGQARVSLLWRRPDIRLPLAVSLLVLASLDLLTAYLPVVGQSRGLGAGFVGGLLSARAAAGLVSRTVLARRIAHWDRHVLMRVMLAGAGCSMGLIALPAHQALLTVAVVIVGATLGMGGPLTMAAVADASPPAERATALSMRVAGNRLGQLVVPAGLGMVAAVTGPSVVFASMCAGLLVATGWMGRSQLPLIEDD